MVSSSAQGSLQMFSARRKLVFTPENSPSKIEIGGAEMNDNDKKKRKRRKKRKRKEKSSICNNDNIVNDNNAGDADKSSAQHKNEKKKWIKVEKQCTNRVAEEDEIIREKHFTAEEDQIIQKWIKVEKQCTNRVAEEDEIIRGKRFTGEEDRRIRNAIATYIKVHGLDEDEGLHMILNCSKYSSVRKCWKEIGAALPLRPHKSVYIRAHVLYERSKERCWTRDEIEKLKSLQAEHGNKWNKIAQVLGKNRYHVKDKWRSIKRGVLKKGPMSQEEYEKMFDLVNNYLQLKSSEKKQKPTNTHNQHRNNINWEAIADKMETRGPVFCCKKWYESLQSSMIPQEKWKETDDTFLLRRLLETNACDEAVDWDNLLQHRSGKICLKRWNEMVKCLGDYRSKPFSEKLELLVRRYAPGLIEKGAPLLIKE